MPFGPNKKPNPVRGKTVSDTRVARYLDVRYEVENLKQEILDLLPKHVVRVNSDADFESQEDRYKIYLEPDTAYVLSGTVDLKGKRLIGARNSALLGYSSENSFLTSTGLSDNYPLFYTEYTTPIRHITFKDVGYAIDIDADIDEPQAFDWTGVNFTNIPFIGTVKDVDNFIYNKGAFLGSGGIKFSGTIGTIAFENSLFRGSGSTGSLVEVESSAIITRRFRTIYSSIIAFGSTTGFDVDLSSTVPDQGFILDTCNFSGGSTYLPGVDFDSNKALFVNNDGITNSSEIAQYYMNGNTVVTTVSVSGDLYKAEGSTSVTPVTQKFSHTDNRATYTGTIVKFFKIVATLSVESGNNNQVGVYIVKNGVAIPESEVYGTTNGSGRGENIVVQAIVELSESDYIEVFVENDTGTQDITVTDLNVIID